MNELEKKETNAMASFISTIIIISIMILTSIIDEIFFISEKNIIKHEIEYRKYVCDKCWMSHARQS